MSVVDEMDDVDEVDRDDVVEVLRDFLETKPLYAQYRFTTDGPALVTDDRRWPTAVTLHCDACGMNTGWALREKLYGKQLPRMLSDNNNLYLAYECIRCETRVAGFWVWAIDSANQRKHVVRKHGQYPSWSIEPPEAVAKALPQQAAEFYRKGLICASHSFGLGAVGYFRRVLEQVTDHLLGLIEETAKANNDQATVDGVEEARRSYQATERLKYAASLLPAHLRQGGKNPLADLYESYSEGLHSLSDEDCLDVALSVQAGLDFLLPALHDHLQAARKYEAAMAKAKRRKKQQTPA